MKQQLAWVLVAALGLSGCGGGGGGGGDDSDSPNSVTDQVRTEDLQGTWIQTTDLYEGDEWISTHRQTIAITRTTSSSVSLKDCFQAGSVSWSLNNGVLSRSGEPALTVENRDTLTAEDGATRIRFAKLSASTQPVVGSVDIYDIAGFDTSEFAWDEVCINSLLDANPDTDNELLLKVSGTNGEVSGSVTLNFVSSGSFVNQAITYSEVNRADENITGRFSVSSGLSVSGNLSNPSGNVNLYSGEQIDMEIFLALDSSVSLPPLLTSPISLYGNVRFDPEWLTTPESL